MNRTHQFCTVLAIAMVSAAGWGQSQSPEVLNAKNQAFSPGQRTEIETRDQLARTIAVNVAADAQGRSDQQWQARLMSVLYGLPSRSLRDIAAQAHTLNQAHALAGSALTDQKKASASTNSAKALNDIADDLVFTPITPCRFIDTRNVGGVIPKGSSAATAFNTALSGGTYGGDSNCSLPAHGEIAIAANITVTVDSGAAGFLGIRPFGTTTRSSLVNWPAGGTPGIANAAIISTALDVRDEDYVFEAYAGGNTPNLIVDYFGYFAPTAPTALDCLTTDVSVNPVAAGTPVLPHVATISPPNCPAGYTQTAFYCQANLPGTLDGTYSTAGGPICEVSNSSSTTIYANLASRCCRLP
jgi:hypothetical protein